MKTLPEPSVRHPLINGLLRGSCFLLDNSDTAKYRMDLKVSFCMPGENEFLS
jgi:hypothetical protein